jgi:holo-[acyl-carrier protein] synthase|tara:strand:- start:5900 stop:6292 length:393 start_codon:yes stop_codon:yes gene_type:complete
MKIFGIGTDIINIKRINNSIKRGGYNFKKKIFSDKEINYCEKKKNPSAFYAKRFAAKEAFTKALGTGIGKGISLKDIEIFNDTAGKPNIRLRGFANNFLKKKIKKNKYNIYLSLSDDEPWAQATVIISYN